MAKFKFIGAEIYVKSLEKLGKNTKPIIKKAIEAGAGVVADQVRANIMAIPLQNGRAKKGERKNGISNVEKLDLLNSFGISPVQRSPDGYDNAKLGFEGNSSIKTEAFPEGKPNAMIARGVESGTSWMKPHPVFRKALKAKKEEAIQKMEEVIEEETKKIMG